MGGRDGKGSRGQKGRTDSQRQGSAALTQVMWAWEDLTDEERLTWNVTGTSRRITGINLFKSVNLRRVRRGEELARLPPQPRPVNPKPLLKRLHIYNRGGRITLKVELFRRPTEPATVWGSRPCNRGMAKPRNCPRLGWLPAPVKLVCEITRPYFQKHRDYLIKHQVQIVGKRIFIRVRRETDVGASLFEQVQAVVPPPEGPNRA